MSFEPTPEGKLRATGRTREAVLAVDRGVLGFARHWLLWFNLFIFAYVGIPFLAPVLMQNGYNEAAKVIYTVYSPLCHQLGYRSWFVFGERTEYPRDQFQEYTGINPEEIDENRFPVGLWNSRNFVGNADVGFKVAFCQRDVAIYGGILLAGLVYGLPPVRRRLKPLHWLGWILIGIVPIAFDGFSQLFTQYPYSDIGFFQALFGWLPSRESTPFLRTLTGGLFGLANVWLAYPYVEQSMREVKDDLEGKLARTSTA